MLGKMASFNLLMCAAVVFSGTLSVSIFLFYTILYRYPLVGFVRANHSLKDYRKEGGGTYWREELIREGLFKK